MAPGSGKNLFRILDPGSRGQKGTGSRIQGSKGTGSRIQGSKRHRIPDPDPQHCILQCILLGIIDSAWIIQLGTGTGII